MDERYVIVAVECNMDGQIRLGYAPDECRIFYGDMVQLENGEVGIVIVKEDYETLDDLKKREELCGYKFQKVIHAYSEKEINWGGVKDGETV